MEFLGYLIIYGVMFFIALSVSAIMERKNATDKNNK